jgi:membrane protein YqaA with SNARE-associated domain
LEATLEPYIQDILAWLASPAIGLVTVFLFSLLAATILPIGSEAVLLGYLTAVPDMFWLAILVATFGNTLGGMVSYGMGAGAHQLFGRWRSKNQSTPSPLTPARARAEQWVHRFGPPVLLLAWLPVVGDPLCAVAGWLRLPLWQCTAYMALGKFARYVAVAWALRWVITPT